MNITITKHARHRMQEYQIEELQVLQCLEKPDTLLYGLGERHVAQKRLNCTMVLRVIFEKNNDEINVITVYKAKGENV